jgi:hypothetical protein
MSGKIIVASVAAILLTSTGLASAATNIPHHKVAPRYYNMVPTQLPNDPAPYFAPDYPDPSGTGVTGQALGR